MIEIFNIATSLLIISLFFNFNLNSKSLEKNIFRNIALSIIIFFNIFLILSFLNFGMKIIFSIILIFSLINLINFIKNLKNINYLYFLLFNFSIFILIAADATLGWDGQMIWYPKAFNFFNGGTFFNLKEYPSSTYPHLGSYIWSIFWRFSFLEYEYSGRFVNVFLYLTSLFLLNSFYKNEFKKNSIIIFFLFLLSFDVNLFKGYQEYIIFSLINIYIIFHYNEKNYKYLFFVTLLIINSIIWVKDEGLFYIIPILILFMTIRKKLVEKINIIFLLIVSLLIFTKIYMINSLIDNYNLQSISISQIFFELFNFTNILNDIFLISKHFIISFFKYPVWLFLFIFIIFPEKSVKKLKIYNDTKYILLFCLMINFLIFHILPFPLEWNLTTALDRLNFILSGYFIFFIYLNIQRYFKKIIS